MRRSRRQFFPVDCAQWCSVVRFSNSGKKKTTEITPVAGIFFTGGGKFSDLLVLDRSNESMRKSVEGKHDRTTRSTRVSEDEEKTE